MRKNNTAIIFGSLFFSCSVMAANGTLAPTVVPMVMWRHWIRENPNSTSILKSEWLNGCRR
ncbi:TPA: hypothetical protein IE828_004858 [Escherichia coli]|nr:hypothetical protein [Escherichia coli]